MRWLGCVVLIGCSGASTSDPDAGPSVHELCWGPEAHVGRRTRIAVDLTSADYREGLSTLVACIDLDGGRTATCCNSVSRTFRLPCGEFPIHRWPQIPLVAGPQLGLAPTGYGAFEPQVAQSLKPASVTLGCLGCETGLSCSPADPSQVKAVIGAYADGAFVVDALEF